MTNIQLTLTINVLILCIIANVMLYKAGYKRGQQKAGIIKGYKYYLIMFLLPYYCLGYEFGTDKIKN